MNVQKENREDTIINADASVFMDAIRNGARGLDDLTNYVFAITNSVWQFNARGQGSFLYNLGYTYTDSSTSPKFPITNGFRIVGLLSTPKFISIGGGNYLSNYVVAYVRSMSGAASEKFPQTNKNVQELTLSYRLIPEILPYDALKYAPGATVAGGVGYPGLYDPVWTNFNDPTLWSPTTNLTEITSRSNFWRIARVLNTNMCDIRLIFRWPLLSGGNAGNRRQVFRTSVASHLLYTNDPTVNPAWPVYFFEPRTFVRAMP
jgi:hypothetical protein